MRGRIAHHGYMRPWQQHYQTGSCLGAKFLPYEHSSDRIPYVIDLYKGDVESLTKKIDQMVTSPPDKIIRRRSIDKSIEYTRPADFKVPAETECGRGGYHGAFQSDRWEYRHNLNDATRALATLEKRLADWKPA